MSRAPSASQARTLSLTEELEKLEQSITLTLQEIDHNFSRAHRIVTSSILPVVEQYATHSKDVWEGSKFWKQFFESSANVSLSNYEEQASHTEDQTDVTVTETEESNATTHTTLETSESYETPTAQHISTDSIQDLDLSNMTLSPSKSSTPRPPRTYTQEATFADHPSPYEALRQEVNATTVDATDLTQAAMPETPDGRSAFQMDDIAQTPQSSPFLPPRPTSIPRPSATRKKTDPLLHRVLDRNYRIQATPLTGKKSRGAFGRTPSPSKRAQKSRFDNDQILSSSPEVAPPQLNADIFSSPERKRPMPGVSVLTPARFQPPSKNHHSLQQPSQTHGVWDDSDEDDISFDQSPPKTMQFHVPQPRLMQTPAKEASKRIVEDILTNAGIDYGEEELDFSQDIDSQDGYGAGEPTSPSVVRKAMNIEDDTF